MVPRIERELCLYQALSIRLLLFLSILESWCLKSQTIVGYPGDTVYGSGFPLPNAAVGRNFYATMSPILQPEQSFLIFGSLYGQLGANISILSCTALNKGTADFDTVCLLGAQTASPTDYSLMMFKSQFLAPDYQPSITWPSKSDWQTIKLAPGKNYTLFPTDTKNELFVLATEFVTATNSTTLYFGRITFAPATKSFTLAVDWTTSPQTLANFRLDINQYTKLCSWLTSSVLIFNPLNSTKAYDNTPQGQPGNNRLVLLHWGSQLSTRAQIVSLPIIAPAAGIPPTVTTRIPNYVMDVEVIDNIIYLSAVDEEAGQPPKAVVMYLRFDTSSSMATFPAESSAGILPKVISTINASRRPFNHFVSLRFTNSLTKFETLIFCHERPAGFDATNRYPINMHLITPKAILINQNTSTFMRPLEPEAEIKVLKLGIGNFQTNIAYLIRGRLVYLDWINYYYLTFPSRNDFAGTVSISRTELVRINTGICDQAISFFNTGNDIQNMAKTQMRGYNLLCLNSNIITMSWAGDSTTYSHIMNIPPTGTVPSLTISTYIPYALPGKTTFETPQSSGNVGVTVVGSLFLPIAYKSGATATNPPTPQKNSIDTIEFATDTVVGGDISYSVVNPHKNMSFFFCKLCDVRFVRDPQDTQPVTIDEVYLVSGGAIFEEINKFVGFMACNDQTNFSARYIEKSCRITQFITTGQWRLSQVLDRTTACQAILFAMESKTNTSRMFYYYDLKSASIITVGEISNVNEHQFACTNTRMLVVGWQVGSETPTVSELVFNRVATPPALVTAPAGPAGFGLKALTNIREGSLNSTEFVFTRWNNATNILEIETQVFNENNQEFKREGFVEYRYLPEFGIQWDSVMILSQHYMTYHKKTPDSNRILNVYEGESFSSNKRYWGKYAINLTEVGFTTVKQVFRHHIPGVSFLSVWGIQSIQVGASNKEYTLIATFEIGAPPKSRLFAVYNSSRQFAQLWALDNNQNEVMFRVKEFQHDASFIRLVLSGNILSAQYGMFAETNYSLVIRGQNRQGFLDYTIPLTFQSVSKIEVTPVKDLDYKQDLVLSLLPGMASKIVGHVTNIEMGNGTGASIRRNRLSPATSIPEITNIPVPSRSVSARVVQTANCWGVEGLYIQEDAVIYLFKNFKFVTKCSLSGIPNLSADGVVQLVLQEARAALDRLLVAVAVGQSKQVYLMMVTGINSTPRCHPVKRAVVTSPTPASNLDLGDSGRMSLAPNNGLGSPAYGFVLTKVVPSKPIEFYSENVATAANGDITVSVRLVTMESLLPPNPAPVTQMEGTLVDCFFLPTNTPENSPLQVSICISKDTSSANALLIYSVNYIFTNLAAARVHKLSLSMNDLTGFGDVSKLQCIIQSDLKIICAVMDFYSKVTTLTLVRDTSSGFCQTDTKFFCLKVDTLQKSYAPQSLVTAQNVQISPDFIVSTIRKRENNSLLNAFVYLHNQTHPNIYFERNMLNRNSNDGHSIRFFGRTNTLYQFDAATMKMTFFTIQEAEIVYSSAFLANLTAELRIGNHDSSQSLNLSSLFKRDATPVAPPSKPTPPPPPPKTFWQKYWWAVAGGGTLLLVSAVGYFIYRREMLKQSSARTDPIITIDSLDEFHYRR